MNNLTVTFKTRQNTQLLNAEDLNDFEVLIGSTLPSDYRQHMETYNGGIAEQYSMDHKNLPDGGGGVSYFYSIKYGDTTMEKVYSALDGALPSGHISIGVSNAGGDILMNLNTGSDFGATKWWFPDGTLVDLSPSFSDLINDMVESYD